MYSNRGRNDCWNGVGDHVDSPGGITYYVTSRKELHRVGSSAEHVLRTASFHATRVSSLGFSVPFFLCFPASEGISDNRKGLRGVDLVLVELRCILPWEKVGIGTSVFTSIAYSRSAMGTHTIGAGVDYDPLRRI